VVRTRGNLAGFPNLRFIGGSAATVADGAVGNRRTPGPAVLGSLGRRRDCSLVVAEPMSSRWRLLVWMLAAAGVAALAVFGLRSQRSASVGRPAPALPRERLAGAPVALAGLAHPVIITFWASWCEPCAREAVALQRFSLTAAGRGHLIGVDWSDALAGARSFVRHHAWSFPNVRDGDGAVGNAYRLAGLPTSSVLGARGHIQAVLRGPQTEQSLRRALAGQ